jgi:hypothetical protein
LALDLQILLADGRDIFRFCHACSGSHSSMRVGIRQGFRSIRLLK